MSIAALFLFILLNALTIIKYHESFIKICDNYHRLFVKTFHVSGFDPLTYSVVSSWVTEYNVYRHPLLAFFMYIPSQINQGLMMLTDMNMVQYVVAALLVFNAFYSFIFMYRIFTEIVGLERTDGTILSFFFFGFAYVMVSAIVPDHFLLSMALLIFTLYLCGLKIKEKLILNSTETIVLFLLTAGISLNNGLKTFLAALFTNGKRFFRIKYFAFAVIIPSALIWLFARYEYRTFVWPREMQRKEIKQKKVEKTNKAIAKKYRDTTKIKDTALVQANIDKIIAQRNESRKKRNKNKRWEKNAGKPIANGEFTKWTDITTPRIPSLVENFFGESLILHQDHLLGDTLRARPVIVHYRWVINYIVEGLIFLMFVLGIVVGRKSRFLWMAMSFFALDAIIHIALGFGINEVYIMTAHWAYVIPIAIAFLVFSLRRAPKVVRQSLRCLLFSLAAYLWIYNGVLLASYMIG